MAAVKLQSFPVPFPDETYFSVLSRYHLFYGALSYADTLLQLAGHRGAVPTNGLPSGLRQLASRLPEGHPFTAKEFLDLTTLLPYFRPFLKSPIAEKVETGMLEEDTSHASALAGLLASRIGSAGNPKFCIVCANEDQTSYGLPFWHRAHHLPGVLVCHRHGTVLRSTKHDPTKPQRHALYLPPLLVTQSEPLVSQRQLVQTAPQLMTIARMSAELIAASLSPLDRVAEQRAYRNRLADMGLMTARNHVRYVALKSQFERTRRLLMHLPEYSFFENPDACRWLDRFVHGAQAIGHPLKHLVFIAWLFGSFNRYLAAMQEPESHPREPNRGTTHNTPNWAEALSDLLVQRNLSLRQAARITGKSVTTLRIHAERLGIKVKRRPKQLTPRVEARIANALRASVPVRVIALRLKISDVTVYRYSRSHPDILNNRRRQYVSMHREKSRKQLASAVDKHLQWGRKAIRHLVPSDYIWLYRHDRKFLQNQLGKLRPVVATSKRWDLTWQRRDQMAAQRIENAARILRLNTGKPVRLTKAVLVRSAGVEKVVGKHLDKLPVTATKLQQQCESSLQFQKRRVAWADDNGSVPERR